MNYLANGSVQAYNILNSANYICNTWWPEKSTTFWGSEKLPHLSKKQNEAFNKIKSLKNEICQKLNIQNEKIKITYHTKGEQIINCGNQDETVLSFNINILEAMASRSNTVEDSFHISYKNKLENEYSSNLIDSIKNAINKTNEKNLMTFLGLHDRCFNHFTDEEMYFVLLHEIRGHVLNEDNKKRTYCVLSTSAINALSYVQLSLMGFSTLFKATISLVTQLFSQLILSKQIQKQETSADLRGIGEDPKAARGALSYFKKFMIAELMEARLKTLKNDTSLLRKVHDNISYVMNFNDTNFEERYTGICVHALKILKK